MRDTCAILHEQEDEMTTTFSVIPRRVMNTVALDTSALSNVLENRDEVARFVRAVRRKDVTVCISDMVVFELSSNADVLGTRKRLEMLQALIRGLGPLLRRSPDFKELMRAEAGRWLTAPLVHPDSWGGFESASRAEVLSIAKQLPESYLWLRKKKKELFESDRNLSSYLAERGQKPDSLSVVEAIKSSGSPRADEMMIELTANMSDGSVSAEQVVADRGRFKATHVLSHFTWRLCIANAAGQATRAHEQVLGMWRTKGTGRGKGTWYDIFIAGAAAYNDILISDDKNQRDRCEFLRKIGLLGFRSIPLREFIG